MNNKRADVSVAEFDKALKAADARGPSPLTYVETREPYGSNRFYKGPSFSEFLANPPADVLEMIAESDPALKARIRGDKATSVAAAFLKAEPRWVNSDENFEKLIRSMGHTYLKKNHLGSTDDIEDELVDTGFFTVENLKRTFNVLFAAGKLEVQRGVVKKLSREELREVAIAVETKGAEFAILDFISLSLGGLPDDLDSPEDLMCRHADLMNEAVLFVWPEARPSFINSPEWMKWFLAKRSGRVGVLTLAVLDSLWAEFKATPAAQRSTAPAVPANPTASVPDYSGMTSEQIAELFEASPRAARIERAKQGR